jgi:hypothetical protein
VRDEWQFDFTDKPQLRVGDEFTTARQIINVARLVMPGGAPRPQFKGGESTEEKRVILAAFLREHGVPVPDEPLPYRKGWLDCSSGEVISASETDGRRFV